MKDVTQGKQMSITADAGPSGVASGSPSEGEGYDNGTRYSATLVERANKSLNRNAGPEHPSANVAKLGSVSMSQRNTGKV